MSAVFDTQITPSGWTFNIWSVIYVWLTAMVIYIVAGLCRKLRPTFYSFLFKTLKYCKPTHRLKDQLWCLLLVGMVMATFTAALQCCLTDSSSAGASICVSTSAGCLFGTEGESLHWELLNGSCDYSFF